MRIDATPESGHPGISLRQLERTDLDAWFAYLSNPDVIQHTSWNLRSENDLKPMFDGFEATDAQSIRRLAIVENAGGNLIGTIGFTPFPMRITQQKLLMTWLLRTGERALLLPHALLSLGGRSSLTALFVFKAPY